MPFEKIFPGFSKIDFMPNLFFTDDKELFKIPIVFLVLYRK